QLTAQATSMSRSRTAPMSLWRLQRTRAQPGLLQYASITARGPRPLSAHGSQEARQEVWTLRGGAPAPAIPMILTRSGTSFRHSPAMPPLRFQPLARPRQPRLFTSVQFAIRD